MSNFYYLVDRSRKDCGVEKAQILHTAQSLVHDHVPAKSMDMASVRIDRNNDVETLEKVRNEVDFT